MLALSIQQPYAEMILRGLRKLEHRRTPTSIIGQRFFIYAAPLPGPVQQFAALGCRPGDLPTGLLIGTAIIHECRSVGDGYEWHLRRVARLAEPLKPTEPPGPVWFRPFRTTAEALSAREQFEFAPGAYHDSASC